MTKTELPPVDVFDFREPLVLAGDPPVHYGWRIDWPAYHKACDEREAYNGKLKGARDA